LRLAKERGDKANARRKRKDAQCSGAEARSWGATGAKCGGKGLPFFPLGFIDPWEPRSLNCAHRAH
jgi:hypothetical protein